MPLWGDAYTSVEINGGSRAFIEKNEIRAYKEQACERRLQLTTREGVQIQPNHFKLIIIKSN